MPSWLIVLLLAAPAILWAVGAAIRLRRPPARTLKATWTYERAADLRAFHTMEAEEQLVEAMAREVRKEIEAEITRDLLDPLPTAKTPLQAGEERLLTGTEKFLQRIKQDPR